MADIVDTVTRSRMMAGIRGRNTKPEILIRSLLHRQGFRFRLHARSLPGRPDIVLQRYGAVIFVNGCFWHGHDCSFFKWPKTRPEFWRKKIRRNRVLDRRAMRELLASGWRVAIVWECAIRGANMNMDVTGYDLEKWLRSTKPILEKRG